MDISRRHALSAASAGVLGLGLAACAPTSEGNSATASSTPSATTRHLDFDPEKDVVWLPTTNMTKGRKGRQVKYVVIHYMTSDRSAADQGFRNPSAGVSAHYGIGEGQISQYVKLEDSAWHAGVDEINWNGVAVEHSADTDRKPSEQTYKDSIRVCAWLCDKYGLDPQTAIRPHSDFHPTACPGTVDVQRIVRGVRDALGS